MTRQFDIAIHGWIDVISGNDHGMTVLDYVQSSVAVSRCSVQGFVVAAARNNRGSIERRL